MYHKVLPTVLILYLVQTAKKVYYLLLGTNSTGKFFLWIIRWAQHSTAVGFDMVKQSTVSSGSTAWH